MSFSAFSFFAHFVSQFFSTRNLQKLYFFLNNYFVHLKHETFSLSDSSTSLATPSIQETKSEANINKAKRTVKNRELQFQSLTLGISLSAIDIGSKAIMLNLFPDFVVFNTLEGSHSYLPLILSFTLAPLSVIYLLLGTIPTMNRPEGSRAGNLMSLAVAFLIPVLIAQFMLLVLPAIDFIPLHGYMLGDFTAESSWGLGNIADLCKPIGAILGISSFI